MRIPPVPATIISAAASLARSWRGGPVAPVPSAPPLARSAQPIVNQVGLGWSGLDAATLVAIGRAAGQMLDGVSPRQQGGFLRGLQRLVAEAQGRGGAWLAVVYDPGGNASANLLTPEELAGFRAGRPAAELGHLMIAGRDHDIAEVLARGLGPADPAAIPGAVRSLGGGFSVGLVWLPG